MQSAERLRLIRLALGQDQAAQDRKLALQQRPVRILPHRAQAANQIGRAGRAMFEIRRERQDRADDGRVGHAQASGLLIDQQKGFVSVGQRRGPGGGSGGQVEPDDDRRQRVVHSHRFQPEHRPAASLLLSYRGERAGS